MDESSESEHSAEESDRTFSLEEKESSHKDRDHGAVESESDDGD